MTHTDTAQEFKRITVNVPAHLLTDAQEQTGDGITETVTAGLKKLAVSRAYKRLLALGGKGNLEIDIEASRNDRDFE